ncbi:SDR family NAD(P)-dependent oxidoreductase [Ulvibacterium sp.]|uniref:SDR family NAD(P)-dependent oxidoreductase n=1 Tax=Ulvibacterium sp. TaxID=2665914 RepID=UPI003BAC6393
MRFSNHLKQRLIDRYGPWALVTGASSGIGKELAERLAEAGLNMVLTGRNGEVLRDFGDALEEKYKIIAEVIIADIASTAGIYSLIEKVCELPIGLFVASAGFGTSGQFVHSPLEQETQMLKVNALALLMLTHYFARRFAEQKKGGIILMSSIVGFQGVPNAAHYAATKAYVQSIGEGLHYELKPYNVDVLAAAPGPVNSGFAAVARMELGNALKPSDIGIPILKALGRKSTVFPGRLTKILIFGLRTVPRWGKIQIMKLVMGGMTKHQTLKKHGNGHLSINRPKS